MSIMIGSKKPKITIRRGGEEEIETYQTEFFFNFYGMERKTFRAVKTGVKKRCHCF